MRDECNISKCCQIICLVLVERQLWRGWRLAKALLALNGMYLFLFGMEKGVFLERRYYGSEWFEHCMVPSDDSVCFFTSVRSSSMCHYI